MSEYRLNLIIQRILTFIFAFAICGIIHICFSSCARKTTIIDERESRVYELDSAKVDEKQTYISFNTDEWWDAYVTKTTYSAPDSTGKQYPVIVETTEAKGGKVVHDTIIIKECDTIRVKVRDNVQNEYKVEQKTKDYKTYIHSILILVIIVIILGMVFRLIRLN